MITGITEEDEEEEEEEEEEVVDDDEEEVIEEVDQFGPELGAIRIHDDPGPPDEPTTPISPFVLSVEHGEASYADADGMDAVVKTGVQVPLTAAALAQMEEEEEAKVESAAAAAGSGGAATLSA